MARIIPRPAPDNKYFVAIIKHIPPTFVPAGTNKKTTSPLRGTPPQEENLAHAGNVIKFPSGGGELQLDDTLSIIYALLSMLYYLCSKKRGDAPFLLELVMCFYHTGVTLVITADAQIIANTQCQRIGDVRIQCDA